MSGAMSSDTMVIDDSLPWFDYLGVWESDHPTDPLEWHYSNSTYTSTQATGASMTFRWEGTDIEIFGGKRSANGWFATKIDDGEKQFNNSYGQPEVPVQLLFSSSGLEYGKHKLVFTNAAQSHNAWDASQGGPPRISLDFDFVRITGTPLPTSTSASPPTNVPTFSSSAVTTTASASAQTTSAASSVQRAQAVEATGATSLAGSMIVYATDGSIGGPHTRVAVIEETTLGSGAGTRVAPAGGCLCLVALLMLFTILRTR